MLVLVILATIFLITFVSIIAITITYTSLALDKIPEWLENAYDFVWDTLEKIFVR